MKSIKFKHIAILLAAITLVIGCSKDDDGPKVSPFVGKYIISSAVLSAPLTLTTNELGDYTLQPGTDITVMIQQALLSAVACTNPTNSRIELREDNSLYLSCDSEGTELNAGTWEEVSATVLKLNMNNSAIPASPAGIALEVTDIVIAGSTLTGSTSVPLPKAMLAAITEQMSGGLATLNLDVTPEVVMVTISIEFTKK